MNAQAKNPSPEDCTGPTAWTAETPEARAFIRLTCQLQDLTNLVLAISEGKLLIHAAPLVTQSATIVDEARQVLAMATSHAPQGKEVSK